MAEEHTLPEFIENRSLFSDYYLSERLGDYEKWDDDLSEPFQKTLELYEQKKAALADMNESQTEQEFIQPVLSDVLGFAFDVQHSVKRQGRVNISDYNFFADEKAKQKAQEHRNDPKYYNDVLALGDAKYWGRSLDGKGVTEKDRNSNANPSFQIVNYLTFTGLNWGILTNGSHWRLYSMKSRSRIDSYFEVDLQHILENKDKEQFKYFYHFFCCQAFQKDHKTDQSFLSAVFEGSFDYGARLEDRLKELIFDEVFLTLAKGFTAYRADEAEIETETEQSLQEIYQGTLRLLYRLLFLLHAESRALLPLSNKGYKQYSLMELKKKVSDRVDQDIPQSKRSYDSWYDLASLFKIIDKGDSALDVPRYNGGLFSEDQPKNKFLLNHKIADTYLVPALELLTRETDPETGRKQFIDYKSLNVEQLGSIYEGLLEFNLRIAEEPLAVVKKKGREVFQPKSEANNPSIIIEQGELHLENDKRERKATGSYYTPHYIVEYIVEHTLKPVFDERAERFEGLMETLKPKYKTLDKLNDKIDNGDQSERTHNKRKALALEVESLENNATETLLSLKVCDPAMGSGHFLKEATDKLAEKIITLLAQFPQNPVTNLLHTIREDILQSLDEQEISIDAEEHLKDTHLIKRMVMKRCIYGVDLNPMAVELAKLSLWLDSFTVGAPLSFLNHHLKTGNSLIGSTVGEIREKLEAGQSHIFGGPFSGLLKAAELMREVSVKTDATYSEVEQSIARYHDFEEAVAPYKKVLDIWLSRHFGNERADEFLIAFSDQITNLLKGKEVELARKQEQMITQAEQLQKEKTFFHWELEFPEVFIDLKQSKWLENPGFDAVVGNPPYDILIKSEREESFINYINNIYKTAEYNPNYYALFGEVGLKITKLDGWNSFIVPNMWLTNEKYSKMRKYLLQNARLSDLIDLKFSVFAEVIPTMVYVLKKEDKLSKNEINIAVIKNNPDKKIPPVRESVHQEELMNYIKIGFTEYLTDQSPIINKEKCVNLENEYTIYRGIETTDNSYYLTTDKRDKKDKPIIDATDVKNYLVRWTNLYVRFVPKELKSNADEDYYKVPSKVLLRRTGDKLIAGIDKDQLFATKNLYLLIPKGQHSSELLCGILNSKLMTWERLRVTRDKGQAFAQLKGSEVANLPIPKVEKEKNKTDRKKVKSLANIENTRQFIDSIKNESKKYLVNLLEISVTNREELSKEKFKVETALDPFKFLNRGAAFKKFSDIFSKAIKYGGQLTEETDIGAVHHDIEGLQLEPENPSDRSKRSDGSEPKTGKWQLNLKFKHRDAETDWKKWKKEDGKIVRSTQPVYRFELSEKKGRYWQQCFEALDEFKNSSSFPGGSTRTTHEKLMKTKIPVFDKNANIEPLIELKEELAETEEKIEKTDWLIDQVVYQLYGLSEEEIAVVERSVSI